MLTQQLNHRNSDAFKMQTAEFSHSKGDEIPSQSIKVANRLKSILLLGAGMIFTTFTFGQSYPVIHQNWTMVGENETELKEVAYQVVQCTSNSSDSIFLNIFNENPEADTFEIDIVIYNEDLSDSTVVNYKIEASGGQMMMHNCGSGEGLDYSFVVPSGYDPKKLTIVPKFK